MQNHMVRAGTSADEGLAVIQHLAACGQLVAAQLPSPSTWTPAKRLAAAVLSFALLEIRDCGANQRCNRQVAKTLRWIAADDLSWPYSFVQLCHVFGLEPEWVRKIVRRWRQAPSKKGRRHAASYRDAA